MNNSVHIVGVGVCMPTKILQNSELHYEDYGIDNAWVQAGGYETRCVAEAGDSLITMASKAAVEALQMAEINPLDLDLLIFVNSTFNAEQVMPTGAPKIAYAIGANKAVAFSMKETCYGFIMAMDYAAKLIKAGVHRYILIVSAEIFSRHTDTSSNLNVKLSVSMGDGAGAIVLSAGDKDRPGLKETFMEVCGELSGSIVMQTKLINTQEGIKHGIFYGFEEYSKQFSAGVSFETIKEITLSRVPYAVDKVLEQAGLEKEQIDLWIFHQPNRIFLEEWQKRVRIIRNKTYDTLARYGNISNCAIPVNLYYAIKAGRVMPGCLICFAAIGEGMGYGAQVWQWTKIWK